MLGENQKLVIDPLTAPLVQEAFTRYAEGETVRAIVESFNERGLTTKKNQPYNINSFNVLFNNRKYIGEYKYQEVIIPGGVPALVSEELLTGYRCVRRKTSAHPQGQKRMKNIF